MKPVDLLEMIVDFLAQLFESALKVTGDVIKTLSFSDMAMTLVKYGLILLIVYFAVRSAIIFYDFLKQAVPHPIWDASREIILAINGDSMLPSFEHGKTLTADLVHQPLSRGDVVLVDGIIDKEKASIKRVIGLPGDILEFDEANHRISVNGRELMDNMKMVYEHYEKEPMVYSKQKIVKVPRGRVFLLGDNWHGSKDSRIVGAVKVSKVKKLWIKNYSEVSMGMAYNPHRRTIPLFVLWKDHEPLLKVTRNGWNRANWDKYMEKVNAFEQEREKQ